METTLFSLTILIECLPTPLKMNVMLILSGQQVWPTYFPQYLPFQLCLLPEADDSKHQILYFANVSLFNYYSLSETHCTLLLIILFVSMWHACWLYATVIIWNHSYTLLTNCTCLKLLILVPSKLFVVWGVGWWVCYGSSWPSPRSCHQTAHPPGNSQNPHLI